MVYLIAGKPGWSLTSLHNITSPFFPSSLIRGSHKLQIADVHLGTSDSCLTSYRTHVPAPYILAHLSSTDKPFIFPGPYIPGGQYR